MASVQQTADRGVCGEMNFVISNIFSGEDEFGPREKRLAKRLEQREFDTIAIAKLIDAAYEREHYLIAANVIQRALALEGFNGLLYQRLARCYYREFVISRNRFPDRNLDMALDSYKTAMRDPKIRRSETPVPYFEVLSIFMRYGQYQAALDVLGAVTTFYKSQTSWVIIAQYNIAQILVLLGKTKEAEHIYRELMLTPTTVTVDLGSDNIVSVSTHCANIYVTLEMSLLLRRQKASTTLSDDLLRETWDRVEKYGDAVCGGEKDLRVGKSSVTEWLESADTYISLGYIFMSNHNSAMAAEMFGKAASMLQIEMETSYYGREKREQYIEALLERAEILTCCGAFDSAEEAAQKAFHAAPRDTVVVFRAANCCRTTSLKNAELSAAAENVKKQFGRVSYMFHKALRRRRRRQRAHENRCATKINAVIRMVLSRNRTAGLRLGNASSGQIGILVQSLSWGLLRTGRQQLDDWLEVWSMSSRTIQTCLRRHERRRRQVMQSRGIVILQSLFRGQRLRRSLRRFFTAVLRSRCSEEKTIEQRRSGSGSSGGLGLGLESAAVFSNNQDPHTIHDGGPTSNIPAGTSPNSDHISSICTNEAKLYRGGVCCGSRIIGGDYGSKITGGDYGSKITGGDIKNINDANDKSTAPSVDSAGGLSSLTSSSSLPRSTTTATTKVSTISTIDDTLSSISIRSAKRHAQSSQWVSFGILPDEDALSMLDCRALAIASPSFRICDCMRLIRLLLSEYTAVKTPEVVDGDSAATSSSSGNNHSTKQPRSRWSNLHSLIVGRTSMGPLGLLKLLRLGISHLETLAINGVGIRGIFGEIIGKALTPIYLHSSSSLSSSISNQQQHQQLQQLHRLSPCSSSSSSYSASTSIMRLFIEDEPRLGDSGFIELAKYLQHYPSLRVLVVRRCMLSSKSTKAAARLISVGPSLEDVTLSGNRFTSKDCEMLLLSVANRGARGRLQRVSIEDQTPALSRNEVIDLYRHGCKLSVRVESELLHAVDVLLLPPPAAAAPHVSSSSSSANNISSSTANNISSTVQKSSFANAQAKSPNPNNSATGSLIPSTPPMKAGTSRDKSKDKNKNKAKNKTTSNCQHSAKKNKTASNIDRMSSSSSSPALSQERRHDILSAVASDDPPHTTSNYTASLAGDNIVDHQCHSSVTDIIAAETYNATTLSYLNFDEHDWSNIHDLFEESRKTETLQQLEGVKFTKRLCV